MQENFQRERIHKLIAGLRLSHPSFIFQPLVSIFVNFAYLHESVPGLAMTGTGQEM